MKNLVTHNEQRIARKSSIKLQGITQNYVYANMTTHYLHTFQR